MVTRLSLLAPLALIFAWAAPWSCQTYTLPDGGTATIDSGSQGGRYQQDASIVVALPAWDAGGAGLQPGPNGGITVGSSAAFSSNFVYMSNAAEDTISRVVIDDGGAAYEEARYFAIVPVNNHGNSYPAIWNTYGQLQNSDGRTSPSRTLVDRNGNVWVALRAPGNWQGTFQAGATRITNVDDNLAECAPRCPVARVDVTTGVPTIAAGQPYTEGTPLNLVTGGQVRLLPSSNEALVKSGVMVPAGDTCAACTQDSDCSGGTDSCVVDPVTFTGFCGPSCVNGATCTGAGDSCKLGLDISNASWVPVCYPSTNTCWNDTVINVPAGDTCATCTVDSDCGGATDSCITDPVTDTGFCAPRCMSSAYACTGSGDSCQWGYDNGTWIPVCYPDTNTCWSGVPIPVPAGDSCTPCQWDGDGACASGDHCVIDPVTDTGFCAPTCSGASTSCTGPGASCQTMGLNQSWGGQAAQVCYPSSCYNPANAIPTGDTCAPCAQDSDCSGPNDYCVYDWYGYGTGYCAPGCSGPWPQAQNCELGASCWEMSDVDWYAYPSVCYPGESEQNYGSDGPVNTCLYGNPTTVIPAGDTCTPCTQDSDCGAATDYCVMDPYSWTGYCAPECVNQATNTTDGYCSAGSSCQQAYDADFYEYPMVCYPNVGTCGALNVVNGIPTPPSSPPIASLPPPPTGNGSLVTCALPSKASAPSMPGTPQIVSTGALRPATPESEHFSCPGHNPDNYNDPVNYDDCVNYTISLGSPSPDPDADVTGLTAAYSFGRAAAIGPNCDGVTKECDVWIGLYNGPVWSSGGLVHLSFNGNGSKNASPRPFDVKRMIPTPNIQPYGLTVDCAGIAWTTPPGNGSLAAVTTVPVTYVPDGGLPDAAVVIPAETLLTQFPACATSLTTYVPNMSNACGSYGISSDQKERIWIAGYQGPSPSSACSFNGGALLDAYATLYGPTADAGPVACATTASVLANNWAAYDVGNAPATDFCGNPSTSVYGTPGAWGISRGVNVDRGGNVYMGADTQGTSVVSFNPDVVDGGGVAGGLKCTGPACAASSVQLNWMLNDTTGIYGNTTIGVDLDANGNPWVNNQGGSSVSGASGAGYAVQLDATTGLLTDAVSVGSGPYSYSDFTGYALRYITLSRSAYTATLPGCGATPDFTKYDTLNYTASVPPGTDLQFDVRAAEDCTNPAAIASAVDFTVCDTVQSPSAGCPLLQQTYGTTCPNGAACPYMQSGVINLDNYNLPQGACLVISVTMTPKICAQNGGASALALPAIFDLGGAQTCTGN